MFAPREKHRAQFECGYRRQFRNVEAFCMALISTSRLHCTPLSLLHLCLYTNLLHEFWYAMRAGHLPDYACLIVGANMGMVGMCKEHMGVALVSFGVRCEQRLFPGVWFFCTGSEICASTSTTKNNNRACNTMIWVPPLFFTQALKVPVFFVITKVDICPEHILKQTVQVCAIGGMAALSISVIQPTNCCSC